MFDFYEKRKLRGWLYSKPVIALLFVLGLFLSLSVYERYKAEVFSAQKRAERAEELSRLTVREQELRRKVEMLESDRGKEEMLREQFDVKKANEDIIVIIDDQKKESVAATTTSVEPPQLPLFHWLKFW